MSCDWLQAGGRSTSALIATCYVVGYPRISSYLSYTHPTPWKVDYGRFRGTDFVCSRVSPSLAGHGRGCAGRESARSHAFLSMILYPTTSKCMCLGPCGVRNRPHTLHVRIGSTTERQRSKEVWVAASSLPHVGTAPAQLKRGLHWIHAAKFSVCGEQCLSIHIYIFISLI